MEEIELPTMEARDWLAAAARECGYPAELADLLGYSAWWLENRSMKGVLRAIVYLLSVHGRGFAALEPQSRDGKLVCLCPIACGVLVASQAEEDSARYADWVGGFATADPVLMAPVVAASLEYRFDLLLRFHDQELLFSEGGATIRSESLAMLHMIDARDGVDSAIRLSARTGVPPDFPYRKRETLKVPRARYLDGGGFRFD